MVLNSYAKINLSLLVSKKLKNGLHNIQSIYCLIDLKDKILLKKIKNRKSDQVSFKGPFSKNIDQSNNSVQKVLNIMRKYKLISNYYSVTVFKKIPIFAGFGGGTGNAFALLRYFSKKKLPNKILNKIVKSIGSDIKLFFHNQGYQKNLVSVIELRKKHKLHFLLAYPRIKSSTKNVYSHVKNYSKLKRILKKKLVLKKNFINYLLQSNNDLQSIVEKQHPIISELIFNISSLKGCYFSRMTGSGSACYGLFANRNCSKVALKKLRKKYPKFWFSIAKTI